MTGALGGIGGAGDVLAGLVEREARETDFGALYRLHAETMRAYVSSTYGTWDDADQERRFREAFASRRTLVIVERSERIVAAFQIGRREAEHFLFSIEVAPSAQGRGIGGAIVRRFVVEAHACGADATLQVMKSNARARQLYERLGFVVTGSTTTHDALCARRSLRP